MTPTGAAWNSAFCAVKNTPCTLLKSSENLNYVCIYPPYVCACPFDLLPVVRYVVGVSNKHIFVLLNI